MPVTIRDIARDAGVSTATVSRVLSGKEAVSPALSAAVMASVAKFGYRPSLLARSLRTNRSFVIAVLIPDVANPFFAELLRAVEDRALEAGYAVMICSSGSDLSREARYLQVLCNRYVDGALIAVASSAHSDLTPMREAAIPAVLVDRLLPGCGYDSVVVDNKSAAATAVSYLVARGYSRLGILTGQQDVTTSSGRLAGFRMALVEHGLAVADSHVFQGDYMEDTGVAIGRRLVTMVDPPDAVLVTNNPMTLGFFRAVTEAGWRVPHDIAVIGFDDSNWTVLATPPITVIDQSPYDLGVQAMGLLLDRLASRDGHEPRSIVLPTRLIRRGSC